MNQNTALITGGSRGIGKAIALQLAKQNINVAICGRNKEKLEKAAQEITATGVRTLIIQADLKEEQSYKTIVDKTIKEFKKLNYIINNAGYATSQLIEETPSSIWDDTMSVNAKAPFFICKHAIPYLKKETEAAIVNISSVVGHIGYERQAAYTASKHALNGFTKALSKEVKEYGIRVHLIEPGGVNTDMVKEMRPDLDTSILMNPDEIAGIVSFLINMRGNARIDNIQVRRSSSKSFQ
jgi:3-oxoacyl-[acyl-carrier protein] reductase